MYPDVPGNTNGIYVRVDVHVNIIHTLRTTAAVERFRPIPTVSDPQPLNFQSTCAVTTQTVQQQRYNSSEANKGSYAHIHMICKFPCFKLQHPRNFKPIISRREPCSTYRCIHTRYIHTRYLYMQTPYIPGWSGILSCLRAKGLAPSRDKNQAVYRSAGKG